MRVRFPFSFSKKKRIKQKHPLGDQVASTELFITRAKKRVDDAEVRVVDAIADRDRLRMELADGERRLARLQDELSRSTMSGPMEQDQSSRIQPTWCPSWSVSDLRLQNSQARMRCKFLMHASRTEVGSELHQVQVEFARVAAGAGRVESACVSHIKSHRSRGSRSVEDCCCRIAPRAQCVEDPTRQESRGSGKDLSSVMVTLIDDAEADLKSGSSRFNPY